MLSTLVSYLPFGQQQQPQGLVLMGGGVFGAAYLGAIKRLRELGRLSAVTHYAGSSIGALVALLVAANCDLGEVAKIPAASVIQCETLLDRLSNFLNRFGFNGTANLRGIIEDTLEASLGVRDITFSELHARTGNRLYVTATEVYRELCREAVYSLALTPESSCVSAVVESCTYPLFFSASKHAELPCIMADGGILNNYPASLLQVEAIGILIEREDPKELTCPATTTEYLLSIIGEMHKRAGHSIKDGNHKITIRVSGSCLDFNLSTESLIALGYDAVK